MTPHPSLVALLSRFPSFWSLTRYSTERHIVCAPSEQARDVMKSVDLPVPYSTATFATCHHPMLRANFQVSDSLAERNADLTNASVSRVGHVERVFGVCCRITYVYPPRLILPRSISKTVRVGKAVIVLTPRSQSLN